MTTSVESLGLRLAGSPTKLSPPRPDFALAMTDGRTIGVEIVEAMNEEYRRGYSGTLGRIVRSVTTEMKRKGLRANVGLSLKADALPALGDIGRNDQHELITRIVQLVTEALSRRLAATDLGWIFDDRNPNAVRTERMQHAGTLSARRIDQLDWIQVTPWTEAVVLTAVNGRTEGPALIQAAIDKKAAKHSGYDVVGLDELWLLVVGSLGPTSFQTGTLRQHMFRSPYARTAFLDCWESRCDWLKTSR